MSVRWEAKTRLGLTTPEYNIAAMVILALETATRRGSMAVLDGDVCHARAGDESRTHGERLPGELVDWLCEAGHNLGSVDLFAIVSGPGSFTGLRVGAAAVQGLAFTLGRKVVEVPTLDAVTESAMPAAAGVECLVACIDGQRGDVFFSMRDVRNATHADEGLVLIEPLIATPEEASAAVASRLDGRSVAITGDGARRYAGVFAARLPQTRLVDESMTLAEAAARIAARHPDRAVVPHAMRPIYLRRPDAVVARERASMPPRPGMAVRRASGAADLAAVDILQRQSFTNPWGAEAIRWELEHTDVARLYVLEASGGAIVAYCACWLVFDELHINSLAVEPARRRQGLARLLLKRVLGEMAEAGARSATLEVRTSNVAARALYEGLGFKVEGIRRNYYQEPKEDGLVLWNRDITATTH